MESVMSNENSMKRNFRAEFNNVHSRIKKSGGQPKAIEKLIEICASVNSRSF